MIEQEFRQKLIQWSKEHPRDLPWKAYSDPYSIWLSEIILQQTRVEQGLPYFLRFKEAFPSVQDLAQASQEEVFKYWEGLGYYSRAKNLHFTAQQIVAEYNGIFPDTYEGLLKLKGVGAYTAAAIASFAFRLPNAVLDGNVYRVLSRIFGVEEPIDTLSGKKLFQSLADELLDTTQPDVYNQAIMNFGATHCLPKSPLCSECPFQSSCYAFLNKSMDKLPVKSKKLEKKNRYFNYFIFRENDSIFIKKREDNDIWQGLFELPMIETSEKVGQNRISQLCQDEWHLPNHTQISYISESRQTLSHQYIHARFYEVNALPKAIPSSFIKTNTFQLFAFPKTVKAFLEKKQVQGLLFPDF